MNNKAIGRSDVNPLEGNTQYNFKYLIVHIASGKEIWVTDTQWNIMVDREEYIVVKTKRR